MLPTTLLLSLLPLLATASPVLQAQAPFRPAEVHVQVHTPSAAILDALATYADPVDALLALHPEMQAELDEPRLLRVFGGEVAEGVEQWMTEGEKLRLRRAGKGFMDITEHQEHYESLQVGSMKSGKAYLPPFTHERLIKPLFSNVSKDRLYEGVKKMTSYYNRYFGSPIGAQSAQWLHDHVAEIISTAPANTYISLEYFTHKFPQPTILATFLPKVLEPSTPSTLIGAHQDSANYLFPLLPAPGADDDCSGSISILEAFTILAQTGYIPARSKVTFAWFAAEEGGLLGSQAVARYLKEKGENVTAMMEFDMTAYIARKANETIGFISTQADDDLTSWAADLSRKYISIPTEVYELGPDAGSDYMSFTQNGYPAAFASEGNPLNGGFPGDYDPYVHTVNDRMDVDDDKGYFSFDHMARFSELAIAYVVEQAGWDNAWR